MTASLNELLKRTSRSFYLTLRLLPDAVRSQIGLAYLLARTTDTIADTELVPADQRLAALEALRVRILGQDESPPNFGELARHQGWPVERLLLERVDDSLALLHTLSAEDLQLVRQVLDTITSGQELDLRQFGGGSAAREDARPTRPVVALPSDADLNDYIYRVAGCVGVFWTKMCRNHLFSDAALDDVQLLADGVRFGKGLQLVNILRDLPRDLRLGRCYVPEERLRALELRPEDLLNPENGPRFRPIYHELLNQAEDHLAAGWSYTNSIPTDQWRVRLACALPILIGVRTIDLLRSGEMLDPLRQIKVPRAQVYDLLLRAVLHVPFPAMFRNLWNPQAGRVGNAIASQTDLA